MAQGPLGVGILGYAPSVGKFHGLGVEHTPGLDWMDVTEYSIDTVHYFHRHDIPATEMPPDLTVYQRHNNGKITIYIPLPNHLHHEWTLRALAAGKHVLCEKPLACSSLQAEEMAAAAHHADRFLTEGLMYRLRKNDAESADSTVADGADEYQLMVEHFADAIRGEASLEYSTFDSIANMRALDALAEAARSGNRVVL